jgi:hypothetical protein
MVAGTAGTHSAERYSTYSGRLLIAANASRMLKNAMATDKNG